MTTTLWPTKRWLGKIWPWSGRSHHETGLDTDSVPDHIAEPSIEVPLESSEERVEPASRDQSSDRSWTLDQLEVGQAILVQAGRNGSQRAEILETPQITDEEVFITVRKFRAKSKSWTKPVRCYPHQIIGLANTPEQKSI